MVLGAEVVVAVDVAVAVAVGITSLATKDSSSKNAINMTRTIV